VDEKEVLNLLGAPKYKKDETRFHQEIGAVTGLAWTAVGGASLIVEATIMPGKGDLKLTGKLGDVMKESALAALSYIRSHAEKYGIESEKFSNFDLHVHVPEGATPKDGPSAGITMATAILSAFTGTPVRGDVAMTGEITLRGKVLPIGGLKEKSLAARRLGIKTVIIPYENKREIEELPAVVQKDVSFIPVKSVDEVFDIMLGDNQSKANPAKNSPKKTKSLPVIPTLSSQDSVRCL
jgi:ATP-dependent Lon protease